jgi:spermidine/putrescine transport system ATP-binding protein
MQVEAKNLQERLGLTFIFVTHDQDEALVMSDRIAVMNQGVIEQVGAPEELYERPRTRFVADFLAVRNILEAEVLACDGGRARLRTSAGLEFAADDDGGFVPGRRACVGVRSERILLHDGAPDVGDNVFQGTLDDEIYLGDRTDWRVRVGGELLTLAEGATSAARRKRGDAVTLTLPPEAVLRLDEAPATRP